MNGGINFSFMGLVFCMQIWGLIMGEDSGEEVGVDHSLLCPPRSHDIFHKPCMDYCARAYRNNNGGACGKQTRQRGQSV
uniref:Secreted protein n=1 Tax=Acrobeloides nanus TaxID=290746 RepID=A0A914BYP2_9BILA